MAVSPTTSMPSGANDAIHWAYTVPDGHAPDPPVVNGNDEMSFSDFLSAINPLQHIPVVGSIYRAVTGDTLNPAAQVVGGALLGGPIGLVFAAVNAVIAEATGSDIGEKMIALVSPDHDEPSEIEKLAAASPTPAGEPALPLEGWAPPTEAVVAPSARVELSAAQQALAASFAKTAAPDPAPAAQAPVLAAARPAAAKPMAANEGAGPHRDLAYYWRQAESRPVVTSGPTPTAASRVLPYARPISIPATSPAPAAAPAAAPPAAPPATPPATPAAAPAAAAVAGRTRPGEIAPAADAPPSAWFAAAMARGLDSYEATKRKTDRGASVDVAE